MSGLARALLALLFAALAACGGAARTEVPMWERPGLYGAVRPEMGAPQPGDAAPELALVAQDGRLVRLADLRGGWVLLHFTATWCPYCDAEVAHLGEVADEFAARGVRTVIVSVKEDAALWASYVKTHVSPRVLALADPTGETAARYAPPRAQPSFPDRSQVVLDATLILDPSGRIRLFLFPDSAHFDPRFTAVRAELDRMVGPADVLPPERVVAVDAPPIELSPGARGEVKVTLAIADGYHVMSNAPSKPNYVATRVALDPSEGLALGAPSYPSPSQLALAGEPIATFARSLEVTVPIELADGASPGDRELRGTVRYQACTSTRCLFPTTQPFRTTLRVRAR